KVADAAPRLAAAAATVSGFCALAYEVIWTRLAALVIGPTTYAFATVVAAFIIGIAIGSAIASRFLPRVTRPAAWLGAMLVIGAAGASAAGWFAAARLPLIVAGEVSAADAAFASIVTRQAIFTILLLLPMTLALGAAFPLALATASPAGEHVGAVAAYVYWSNTVGAIAGSLAGGFALLPWLGLHGSLRATAAIGIVAAVAIWGAGGRDAAAAPRGAGWRGCVRGAAAAATLV